MRLHKLDALTGLAALLATIGALNWGLTGLLNFNLVRKIFGRAPAAERAVYGVAGLAGAWMAVQLAVPVLSTALTRGKRGAGMATWRRSIVGERLPTIEGTTLSGNRVRLPEDVAGKVTLLVMGFAYDARWEVEAWADAFRERFAGRTDFVVYEMPMIGGIARLAAPMIDAGMRAGTPAEMYDNVVTVYGSMAPFRDALGAGYDSDAWVYLIGPDGTVLFQSADGLDEAAFAQLADAADLALAAERRGLGQV